MEIRQMNKEDLKRENGFRGEGIVNRDFEERVEKIITDYSRGNTFTYLFRRFGYPKVNSDPYKDLCEYALSTDMDNLFLIISPKVHLSTSLGYLLPKMMFEKVRMPRRFDDVSCEWADKKLKEIYDSLVKTIKELKKVVFIRDVPINFEGKVKDEEVSELGEVERHKDSGYGLYSIVKKYKDEVKE